MPDTTHRLLKSFNKKEGPNVATSLEGVRAVLSGLKQAPCQTSRAISG